jgi:hypothetical protein
MTDPFIQSQVQNAMKAVKAVSPATVMTCRMEPPSPER